MAKDERLESLIKYLKKASKELEQKSEKYKDDYTRRFLSGESIAYELCAKWISEILE